MRALRSIILLGLLATAAHAGSRTSANYNVPTDSADSGGRRTTSANYINDGSVGGITGLSTVAAPVETARSGYIGQLFEVIGLTVTAVTLDINEGATNQLGAWQALDDDTFLAVPAINVAWSVLSGPLIGIDANGLATASLVYQDTFATAQALYQGQTGTLDLTVRNLNPDDFGSYAADGLDDAWQVQYFGLDNPLAAPTADPDGDGETNLFEFTAGLIPTDPQSRLILAIQPVIGQPAQKAIVFTPLIAGRTYTVGFKTSLTDSTWQPLTGALQSDNGTTRTVTDTSATGPARFYRVEVTKP